MKTLTEEDDKVLPFVRPSTGGGFGGGTVSDVWLDNYPEGTVFLAQEKGNTNFLYPCFILSGRFEKAVFLLQDTGQGSHVSMWVNPQRFCNRYSLVQVLQVLDRPQKEEGTTDGTGNGSISTGELASNEDVAPVNPDDETS